MIYVFWERDDVKLKKLPKLWIWCFIFSFCQDEIFSSATLAGLYLQAHLQTDETVFVLGSQGLHDEIESFGVKVAPLDSEDHVFDIQGLTETLKIDPNVSYHTTTTALTLRRLYIASTAMAMSMP